MAFQPQLQCNYDPRYRGMNNNRNSDEKDRYIYIYIWLDIIRNDNQRHCKNKIHSQWMLDRDGWMDGMNVEDEDCYRG